MKRVERWRLDTSTVASRAYEERWIFDFKKPAGDEP